MNREEVIQAFQALLNHGAQESGNQSRVELLPCECELCQINPQHIINVFEGKEIITEYSIFESKQHQFRIFELIYLPTGEKLCFPFSILQTALENKKTCDV